MADDYDKALGQFQLQLNGVMKPLRKFGQGDYVDSVIPEILKLAVQLHMRLCGEDVPIQAENIHW